MAIPSRFFVLVGLILASWLPPSLQGFVLPSSSAVTFGVDVSHSTFLPSSPSRTSLESIRSRTSRTSSSTEAATIVKIESHADWLELIEDYDDDDNDIENDDEHRGITAVTFTASWCKFCQKFLRMWKRKVVEKQQRKDSSTTRVQFASVDYGSNRRLCQALKIEALPTVQFYDHKGNLLYSFACGPKKFKTARETLARYLEMTPQQIQQEAENDTTRNSNDSDKIDDRDHLEEVEVEEEPAMFLRKRDRLKRKLLGKSRNSRRKEYLP